MKAGRAFLFPSFFCSVTVFNTSATRLDTEEVGEVAERDGAAVEVTVVEAVVESAFSCSQQGRGAENNIVTSQKPPGEAAT